MDRLSRSACASCVTSQVSSSSTAGRATRCAAVTRSAARSPGSGINRCEGSSMAGPLSRNGGRSHVLLVMDPNGKHATSLFSNATTGAPEFWYVDLIGPVARRGACLDFLEHGLDVVIELDLRRWKFKDADELEWNVTNGVYNRAEADALYAEGEAAVAELIRSRARFEQWLAWTPDPSWEPPQMPAGWDAV